MPLPGTAGRETRFLSHTIAAYWMMRPIGFVATRICGPANVERRNAGQRYGRNTARRQARSSSCAAMVRAWPRQRRNSSTRSHCRRDQRTCAAIALQPSSAACVHRLVGAKKASHDAPLPSNPCRVARALMLTKGLSAPMRFLTDPAISLQRQSYGSSSEALRAKDFTARKPVVWAENGRKRSLLPMGEVCLNAKKTLRRSSIHEK